MPIHASYSKKKIPIRVGFSGSALPWRCSISASQIAALMGLSPRSLHSRKRHSRRMVCCWMGRISNGQVRCASGMRPSKSSMTERVMPFKRIAKRICQVPKGTCGMAVTRTQSGIMPRQNSIWNPASQCIFPVIQKVGICS